MFEQQPALAAVHGSEAHSLANGVGVVVAVVDNGVDPSHAELTGSALARRLLERWGDTASRLVRVMPNDYRRMLDAQAKMRAKGLSPEEAEMAAFEENARDEMRVGGN